MTDQDIIEAVAREIPVGKLPHWKEFIAIVIQSATPLITEKVLREMMQWELYKDQTIAWSGTKAWEFAKTARGIDLTKDTDNG